MREKIKARLLTQADEKILLSCGVDPASLKYLKPKLQHRVILLQGVKLYVANILKQTMLSLGGDAAVHRDVISGKIVHSDCVLTGDLRHFRGLIEKLTLQPGLTDLAELIKKILIEAPSSLELSLCSNTYRWDKIPVIMGILNITDDSFSDGGKWIDPDHACDHAQQMMEEGAQIIDIGGESSRPGARAIDTAEEISRVIPVIKKIATRIDIPISIDTTKAEVARNAIDAGACLLNDISALRHDPDMLRVPVETGAGVILMHKRGTPRTMQKNTHYNDIMTEIYNFLDERVNTAIELGLNPSSIIIDPGIGFGKDINGNLKLISHIAEFKSLGMPVLLGHSKKAFIGEILDQSVDQREEGTDAVTSWSILHGVDIVRVHNVGRTQRTKKMLHAIMENV